MGERVQFAGGNGNANGYLATPGHGSAGPGLLVILLGAFLIGEESLSASRLLDRCDAWCSRRLPRRRGVE